MKNKLLLIALAFCFGLKGQTTYTVTMNVSPSWIFYHIGDTLKFYTPTTSTYTLYPTTVTSIAHGEIISPTVPSTTGYVGTYKVQCLDSIINMTNTNSQYWTLNDSYYLLINCNTDIEQIANINNQISIYPNPINSLFTIKSNTADKLNIDLYDINGKHVYNTSVTNTADIDVSKFNNGIYNLTIKSNTTVINKKLVVAH